MASDVPKMLILGAPGGVGPNLELGTLDFRNKRVDGLSFQQLFLVFVIFIFV